MRTSLSFLGSPAACSRLLRLVPTVVIATLLATVAYGQGGNTAAPLSGVAVDASGAPVPGAAVTVTNEATGITFQAVTSNQGTFTVPALQAGTYSVAISLPGFKQVVIKGVKLLSVTPAAVKAVLDVGGVEETVTVEGGAPLVQTQSATISSTIEVNAITNLPVQSRNAIDTLVLTPGVLTPAGNRDSIISGLDQSAINITVDGMSVQDNYLKTTDGYFARLSPRLDMVEEVTITSAAGNADNSGMGAAQISFTTRRGTNEYTGSVYEYFRRDWLNANTWFNNRDLPPDPRTGKAPQAKLKFDNPGFRIGGPIRIPGLFDGRNRAHFFINYEESRTPSDVTRNRNILSMAAQQGIFRYNAAGGVREVNLLDLAARNGQTSTMDPVIAKLLADIRGATTKTGGVANLPDPNVQRYTYQTPANNITRYPTIRLDFQATQKHLVTVTGTLNKLLSDPDTLNGRDPQFPGFPVGGVQDSKRYIASATLRSALTSNLVNEARVFGASGGATFFAPGINPSMWKGTPLADQAGFQLNLNGVCCATVATGTNLAANQANNITNPSSGPGITSREGSTKVAYDHMTWSRGAHSLGFGVDFTQADVWLQNQTQVPTIIFGVNSDDPAAGLFTTANFPGASAANLNAARGLYAILTGRVQAILGNARLDPSSDEYKFLGSSRAQGRLREFDFFVNDTWRVRGDLTLNYGMRYALQLPMYPVNNSYATATLADVYGISGVGNLFQPGARGQKPVFVQFKKGAKANNTDWNNLAPSLGFAWRPSVEQGFLKAILGSEPVIRGGFSMAYSRNGMSDFTDIYGSNPGIVIDTNRDQSLGNLGTAPLLLRDPSRLGPPSFQTRPIYPNDKEQITGDISIFDPDLQVPYSQTWSVGVQRQLSRTMAIDVRYIGSRGRGLWGNINYNESNLVENGFLNEFRLAQSNLQANIRAGRGNTFAYFGPGTGTSPLPIYLAYLNGVPTSQAGDHTRYTGPSWADTNFTNPLAIFFPQPYAPAGVNANSGLDGSQARRNNARAAGLPANLFRANPDLLGGAFVRSNRDYTNYHAFEIQLKRRYARGFYVDTSYTLGKSYLSNFYTLRGRKSASTLNTGEEGGVTHSFKLFGGWDLPFGKGRRFASGAPAIIDAVIGGWTVSTTGRLQSGRLLDFGNVKLVGMSKKEFSKMFQLRYDDAGRKLYMLPQEVIDNTIRAFSVSATSPTGYGALGPPSGRYLAPANGPDCISMSEPALFNNNINYGFDGCGTGELVVTGPMYKSFDVGIQKQFNVKGNVKLVFRAELLNAFNFVNFTPVATASSAANAYEVTQTVGDVNNGARVAQLVLRLNW
jgi:hypothetical protein